MMHTAGAALCVAVCISISVLASSQWQASKEINHRLLQAINQLQGANTSTPVAMGHKEVEHQQLLPTGNIPAGTRKVSSVVASEIAHW